MKIRIFCFITILNAVICNAIAQSKYDFIHEEANRIELKGADWSLIRSLAHRLSLRDSIGDSVATKMHILHIGDSHIQAGHFSEAIRTATQTTYGNGGRGCIAPLRLIGTNQPTDYTITSPHRVARKGRISARNRSNLHFGLTGVAAMLSPHCATIEIGVKQPDDEFTSITLLHASGKGYREAKFAGKTHEASCPTAYESTFTLEAPSQKISLADINASSEFWGVFLSNPHSGAIVSSIGNNSACYSHYNHIPHFAEQAASLAPQLVIISLGTNEAFGRFSESEFTLQIDKLVTNLRRAMPQVCILLTTPMECDRRKGSRRRRRRRQVSFATNANCKLVRDAIIKYGSDHNIAVWDLYEVAGGDGSAAKWVQNGLLAKRDHVHCSTEGYTLQGELLSIALLKTLSEE